MALYSGRTTLSRFLIEQLQDAADHGQLASLLVDVAAAVKAIAAMTGKGALVQGAAAAAGSSNPHGEQQLNMDLAADALMIEHCTGTGLVAGLVSEEQEQPLVPATNGGQPPYLLCYDPLDGSSNMAVNVSVGTIFSVLRHDRRGAPTVEDFLQPGHRQVAAGYAIYGPATVLVLTVGKGTHGFTLDREVGNFVLTHPEIRIPESTSEFAINTSNERIWEPPVQRYVNECIEGEAGPRGRRFNMRWIASMVADVHRILIRGGVFLYPRSTAGRYQEGRLRLLYEANPLAMVVEQAGGRASTGRRPLLEVTPESHHQYVPVVLGSREEVERIERYHHEYDNGEDQPYQSPLFRDRSLFESEL